MAVRAWFPCRSRRADYLREHGFLRQRGALHMVREGEEAELARFVSLYADTGSKLAPIDRMQLAAMIPGLRQAWTGAVHEPACSDIDVAGLHQHYLGLAAQGGASLICRARLAACHREGEAWKLVCEDGRQFEAGLLVNAAGAWADGIARLAGAKPLGITPYRRTVVQLALREPPPADLPLVLDMAGTFYFKPENGRLWLSPHDEVADVPGDAAADEMAVAEAIDRFEKVVDWQVERVERRWAGLRSFAPDRLPVYGFDPGCDGFFWCAGQGGFGIQTAPAAARMAAQIIRHRGLDGVTASLDPASYAPSRFN